MDGLYARSIVIVMIGSHMLAFADEDPVGHMQVLGSHRPPSVNIDEFKVQDAPYPQEFYERYVRTSKPVIFRGAVKVSDAFKLWTDDYIREKYGDVEVRIETPLDDDSDLPSEKYVGREKLRHFLNHIDDPGSKASIVSHMPVPLFSEVGVPPSFGSCGEMSTHVVKVYLRWSGKGSKSPLQKDGLNQIYCLYNGTQQWKLIEGYYENYFCDNPAPDYLPEGFADIDPQKVDLKKYPRMSEVEWSNLTIYAGDCIFLPKSYYQQVRTSGTHNLAVSIAFGRFDDREELDFMDCGEHIDYHGVRPLGEFKIQWPWSGIGSMVESNPDLEDVYRVNLMTIVNDYEGRGEHFTYETMKDAYSLEEQAAEGIGDPRESFRILDRDGDGKLTPVEVKELTHDELRQFAYSLESRDTPEDRSYEYYEIPYPNVRQTLRSLLDTNERIERKTWIKAYGELGGSEHFADEIFSRLSGQESSIRSKRVTDEDIELALENWRSYWSPQDSSEVDEVKSLDEKDDVKLPLEPTDDEWWIDHDLFDDEIELFDVDFEERDEL